MGLRHKLPALACLACLLIILTGCDAAFLAEFRDNVRGQLGTAAEGQMCGDRSDIAAIIADCPMEGACFTTACQAHDQCYAACAVSRAECDRQFRIAAGEICTASFPLGEPSFNECLYFAHLYWTLVGLYGEEFYVCDNVPPTGPQAGACCTGSGGQPSCAEVASQAECPFGELFIAGLTCDEVEEQLGGCPVPPNDDCENATRVCEGQAPGQALGYCDRSASSRVCSVNSQDCIFGEACLPHDADAYRCIIPADNRLSSTDGPDPGEACGVTDQGAFQADVWFEYVAPCSGRLSIQMCNGTFYDSLIAVYGSNISADGCVCPESNEALLICDDDGCGGFGNPSAASLPVVQNACYVIRVGGWSATAEAPTAARGISRLDIGVLCDPE